MPSLLAAGVAGALVAGALGAGSLGDVGAAGAVGAAGPGAGAAGVPVSHSGNGSASGGALHPGSANGTTNGTIHTSCFFNDTPPERRPPQRGEVRVRPHFSRLRTAHCRRPSCGECAAVVN
jgi:hypothetical protein